MTADLEFALPLNLQPLGTSGGLEVHREQLPEFALAAGPFHHALATGVFPPLLGLAGAHARGGDPCVAVFRGDAALDDLECNRTRHDRTGGRPHGEVILCAQVMAAALGGGRRRHLRG